MPNATDILADARELESEYGNQFAKDNYVEALYRNKHGLELMQPGQSPQEASPGVKLAPVTAAIGGQAVDAMTLSLLKTPFFRVEPLGASVTAEQHASKLEDWANGAFVKLDPTGSHQYDTARDVNLFARAFAIIHPEPHLWSGQPFRRKSKETDDDYSGRLDDQKRLAFPIIWLWKDPRECRPIFKPNREIEKLIVVHKEPAYSLAPRYADIPELQMLARDERTRREIQTLYIYYDDEVQVVVWEKAKDQIKRWSHGMGVCPAVIFDGPRFPKNSDGEIWKSALYDLGSLVNAYDETLSDIRTGIRSEERSPLIPFLDYDKRSMSNPDMAGLLNAGWNWENPMLVGERMERLPPALIDPKAALLLAAAKGRFDELVSFSRLEQTLATDQSGTSMNLARQMIMVKLAAQQGALISGYTRLMQRVFACVGALSKKVPAKYSDKVYVRWPDAEKKSLEIAVGPKDVENYGELIRVELDLALPVNERGKVEMHRLLMEARGEEGPIIDDLTGLEGMGYENPLEIIERRLQQRIIFAPENIKLFQQAFHDRLAGRMARKRGLDLADPRTLRLFAEIEAVAPDVAQALIGGDGAQPGATMGSQMAQGAANRQREGELVGGGGFRPLA